MFALSDRSPQLIPIDEQPNHEIVHLYRLGKANRATNQPLDPGLQIDVFALDFLSFVIANAMLIGVKLGDPERVHQGFQFQKHGVFAPPKPIGMTIWEPRAFDRRGVARYYHQHCIHLVNMIIGTQKDMADG